MQGMEYTARPPNDSLTAVDRCYLLRTAMLAVLVLFTGLMAALPWKDIDFPVRSRNALGAGAIDRSIGFQALPPGEKPLGGPFQAAGGGGFNRLPDESQSSLLTSETDTRRTRVPDSGVVLNETDVDRPPGLLWMMIPGRDSTLGFESAPESVALRILVESNGHPLKIEMDDGSLTDTALVRFIRKMAATAVFRPGVKDNRVVSCWVKVKFDLDKILNRLPRR